MLVVLILLVSNCVLLNLCSVKYVVTSVPKQVVGLGVEARDRPFLTAQAPSVRGRHLLLWGRNPFYRQGGARVADLRVRLRGEGLSPESALRLTCRVGVLETRADAAAPPATASKGGSVATAAAAGSSGGPDERVLVSVRHMQTEAKLCLRLPKASTMGDVRKRIVEVVGLPRGATVRLLQPITGGFTPYQESPASPHAMI